MKKRFENNMSKTPEDIQKELASLWEEHNKLAWEQGKIQGALFLSRNNATNLEEQKDTQEFVQDMYLRNNYIHDKIDVLSPDDMSGDIFEEIIKLLNKL